MEKIKELSWFFQVIFNEEKRNKDLSIMGDNSVLKLDDIYRWILIGYEAYVILFLVFLTAILFISEKGKILYMPLVWVISALLLLIHVLMIIILRRTHKTLETLKQKCKSIRYIYQKYVKSAEGLNKVKPGFFFGIHNSEKYIEDMELKGYRLYGISPNGWIISFRRGEPRRIKCCIDIQSKITAEYFQLYEEAGWEFKCKADSDFYRYIIWVREYEEKVPHIYSENKSKYEISKKALIFNSIFCLPLLIIGFIVIRNEFLYNYGFRILWDCFIELYCFYYYCRTIADFINVRKENKKIVI